MWDASPAMLDKAETATGTRAPGRLDPFGKEMALRVLKKPAYPERYKEPYWARPSVITQPRPPEGREAGSGFTPLC